MSFLGKSVSELLGWSANPDEALHSSLTHETNRLIQSILDFGYTVCNAKNDGLDIQTRVQMEHAVNKLTMISASLSGTWISTLIDRYPTLPKHNVSNAEDPLMAHSAIEGISDMSHDDVDFHLQLAMPTL